MTLAGRPYANFDELLRAKNVVVVCGSGGVGKTTMAAAIAAQAAVEDERSVLVITIDPARRLADALGLGDLGDEPTEVPAEALVHRGIPPKGRLFASMLDAKASWDLLVQRHAADVGTAQRILKNPLYRNITGRFVQSHDYIAMERLYELHESGKFDLIVVDTPPASHAIDFLEAPSRMADFFDSRLLKFLVAPARSKWMALTSRPFMQIADRILGQRFLGDITEFFTLLESMRPGFIKRANSVQQLLSSKRSTFVVVTTLEFAPRREANGFIAELTRRHLHLGAMIFNRVLPAGLLDARSAQAAAHLSANAASLAANVSSGLEEQPTVTRVLAQLGTNFNRFSSLAAQEEQQRRAFTVASAGDDDAVVVSVPWMGGDLDNMETLLRVGAKIWT